MKRIVECTIKFSYLEHEDIGSISDLNEKHTTPSSWELMNDAEQKFLADINTLDNDGDLAGYIKTNIIYEQPRGKPRKNLELGAES